MILDLLFYCLSFWLIITSIVVVFSNHAVISVFSLILTFFNAAGLFLLLQAEYLAFSLLIVYVGAVAVLFLFVIMFMDIKKISFKSSFAHYKKSLFGLFFLLIFEMTTLIIINRVPFHHDDLSIFSMSTINAATNTHALGDLLYTYHFLAFELCGVALLVAMVGAIVLVHEKNKNCKRQNTKDQLKRTKENSLHIVKVSPVIKDTVS